MHEEKMLISAAKEKNGYIWSKVWVLSCMVILSILENYWLMQMSDFMSNIYVFNSNFKFV